MNNLADFLAELERWEREELPAILAELAASVEVDFLEELAAGVEVDFLEELASLEEGGG